MWNLCIYENKTKKRKRNFIGKCINCDINRIHSTPDRWTYRIYIYGILIIIYTCYPVVFDFRELIYINLKNFIAGMNML